MRQISCVFLHDFSCMIMMIKINKMKDEMKREGEMLTDEFNLVLPIPVGARDKARKFLLFLTFFFFRLKNDNSRHVF